MELKNKSKYMVNITNSMYESFVWDKYLKDIFNWDEFEGLDMGLSENEKINLYVENLSEQRLSTVRRVILFESEVMRDLYNYGLDEFFNYIIFNFRNEIIALDNDTKKRTDFDELEKMDYEGSELYFVDCQVRSVCKQNLKAKEIEFIKSLMNDNQELFFNINLSCLLNIFPELKEHYAKLEAYRLKKEISYSDNGNTKNKRRI
ncbi:hypothetical protein SS41_23220 [Enterobacter hormaechei subsp. xiangfangensis]|uniref:hypothetical protein n=1 Tax=Enterobacter hormaechei TaxID=158836 RepID=UPI0005EE1A5A|nr:hypothetical protein [Enterobacter hormaechei]KJN19168.1 hypothetical protein SS41_23220 [Enterobacter hormaechei subsp. xiangfangensis]